MRARSAILGSLWIGLVAGAVCGLVLSLVSGSRLPVAYVFSLLFYGAAGGAGGLLLSMILVRLVHPRRSFRTTTGIICGVFAFIALAYWGNRWLLINNPFTSRTSLTFDGAALAVSILIGTIIAWAASRWGAAAGDGRERLWGRLTLTTSAVVIGLPLVLLLVISARSAPPASREAQGKPSVVLISIDALRADHLGCYGYPRKTSRVVDRLAEEGVRFEYVFCPVPSTGPSHATMLTGLTPPTHGLRRNGNVLDPGCRTLAEILSEAGYATGGFTTNIVLDQKFGFTQGFDTYVESGYVEKLRPVTWSMLVQTLSAKEIVDKFLSQTGRGEDITILSAGKWLRENSGSPFFLFLHLLDPHDPYEPLEPYRSMFMKETEVRHGGLWLEQGRDAETVRKQIALYDGEIAATDAKVGRLLEFLKDAGVLDRTLIVFTSDHGENMGDHEPFFRHADVYDASIRVPLILRLPGVLDAGQRVTDLVENSALLPTILSLVHLDPPEGVEGEDLVPLMKGNAEDRFRFALGNSGKQWSLRTDLWKLRIDFGDGSRRLYNVGTDPEETTDVLEDNPETAGELEALLLAEIERREGQLPTGEEEASPFEGLDRQTIERLRALGYVQ